jgi:hypothetical protein
MLLISERKEVWLVTSGASHELQVYDTTKRERLAHWEAHERRILALCRVENEVWTGGLDLVIKVWSVLTHQCTRTIKGKMPISCFELVDDQVWAGSDLGIRVFKGVRQSVFVSVVGFDAVTGQREEDDAPDDAYHFALPRSRQGHRVDRDSAKHRRDGQGEDDAEDDPRGPR